MYIHEYGDENAPKILCQHPMGITGENLYQEVIPYLKGQYCIIAPDQTSACPVCPDSAKQKFCRFLHNSTEA